MRSILALMISSVSVLISSCAPHYMMRGTVAMKVSDRQAHVCLGKGEVSEGAAVALYRQVCRPHERAGRKGHCVKTRIGGGRVIEVLNDHYSIVEMDPDVIFEEGTVVETVPR